jgi:hypothetical protein
VDYSSTRRHESYSDSVQSRVIYCKTCRDVCRVRTHKTKHVVHVVRAYMHPGSRSPYAPLLYAGIATKCDFVSSDQMQFSDFNATPPPLGRTKVGTIFIINRAVSRQWREVERIPVVHCCSWLRAAIIVQVSAKESITVISQFLLCLFALCAIP